LEFQGGDAFRGLFEDFAQYGIFSRIGFVLLGALVTVVVQSSSAAMAVTLTLVYAGWLPLEVAAAMVLGENIGTTITAEIASLVGNTESKRSARIHSMFNIIGVCWMVILLPWVIEFLTTFVESFSSIFESNKKIKTEGLDSGDVTNTYILAAFHTTFNIINVFMLIWFVPWLVNMAIKTVPNKEDEDSEEGKLKFIGAVKLLQECLVFREP